jgi:hypothetical protein
MFYDTTILMMSPSRFDLETVLRYYNPHGEHAF